MNNIEWEDITDYYDDWAFVKQAIRIQIEDADIDIRIVVHTDNTKDIMYNCMKDSIFPPEFSVDACKLVAKSILIKILEDKILMYNNMLDNIKA